MVLIGRLTKDAVVSQLKNDRKVVNFIVAVNDGYKPKGKDTWETITTFITCAYWINPKIAERLKKGNLVELTGRLYVNAYTDMQGNAKASINCHVDAIKIHQQMKQNGTTETLIAVKDDLPF